MPALPVALMPPPPKDPKLIALNKLGQWRNQNPTLYQIIQEVQQHVNTYILEQRDVVDAQIAAWVKTYALNGNIEGTLNVRDFGAVGDGAANDSPAISLAFAAIPSTGGVIVFPPGTYLIGTTITVPAINNLTMLFQGCTVKSGLTGGFNVKMFAVTAGNDHVTVLGNLVIDGASTDVSGFQFTTVGLVWLADTKIKGITASANANAGIYLNFDVGSYVQNVRADDCNVLTASNSVDARLHNLTGVATATRGQGWLQMTSCTRISLSSVHFDGGGFNVINPIQLSLCTDVDMVNFSVTNMNPASATNGGDAIDVINQCTDVRMTNGNVQASRICGITLAGSRFTLANVIVKGCGGPGIQLGDQNQVTPSIDLQAVNCLVEDCGIHSSAGVAASSHFFVTGAAGANGTSRVRLIGCTARKVSGGTTNDYGLGVEPNATDVSHLDCSFEGAAAPTKDSSGATALNSRASIGKAAPADGDLLDGQISWYLDEAGNNLVARIRYSNGTLKTFTAAIV